MADEQEDQAGQDNVHCDGERSESDEEDGKSSNDTASEADPGPLETAFPVDDELCHDLQALDRELRLLEVCHDGSGCMPATILTRILLGVVGTLAHSACPCRN
jgi:hypothetical protein